MKSNITLIGMPGAGKSVVGVLLAKRLGKEFIDTDLVIQNTENKLLKDIIAEHGLDGFLQIEDRINSSIQAENAIISPGGSVVYGEQAMKHFKEISHVIYLRVSFEDISRRLGDLRERGIAIAEGMTLRDLYVQRCALYERYADEIIDETDETPGQTVDKIVSRFSLHEFLR